jgi:hypothetical protein
VVVLKKLGRSLSKARSLVGIHLTGNPGITDRVLRYVHQRIKCKEPYAEEPPEDLNSII